MDEMESFEGYRSARPLTLPVIICEESMFIIAARCAPIRPSGSMPEHRKAAIEADAARHGRRPNRSQAAVLSVLRKAARQSRGGALTIKVDKKSTYPALIKRAFAHVHIEIKAFSSRLKRDASNPLFRINLTNAIARDLCGRLRRRSWLVSKKRWFLNQHLKIFLAYRNYVRIRFNDESQTPAQLEGFAPRPLRPDELLSWRQSWGAARSIHPLSSGKSTVLQFLDRCRSESLVACRSF